MRPDPKFGWHTLWITPLAVIVSTADRIRCYVETRRERRRPDEILRRNPDVRELSELSGIRKPTENR